MKWQTYSAEAFNNAIRWARRHTPIAGLGCRLERIDGKGVRIHADSSVLGHHPWQIRCAWSPEASAWEAFIHPGLVNGRDVRFAAADGSFPALTDDPRPGLALAAFRNPLESAGLDVADGGLVALPGEGYPGFFDRLGVATPAPGGDATRDTSLQSEFDEARTRQLRAIDIALVVPRLATRQEVTFTGLGTASSLSINTVLVNGYALSAPAPFLLKPVPKWIAPREPEPIERFLGTWSEPETDELLIATVWFVSPPDAAPDAQPDASWTPYPQHFVWWNLNHASVRNPPDTPQQPITIQTGLLGGAADQIFNAILTPTNDEYNRVNAFLDEATFRGHFFS